MKQNKSYTWEQAVIYLQRLSEYRQLIIDAYLDENPIEAVERYAKSEEFNEVISLLRRTGHDKGKLLDVGAGNGIASYAFATQGYEVYALEPDSSTVVGSGAIKRIINEKGVPIYLLEGYGEKIDLLSNTIDIVFARQVLHHASSLDKMCQEVYRILKPGGCLLAIREHVVSNEKQLEQFLLNHPLHGMYGGENAFRLKEYVSTLKKAGFSNVNKLGPFETVINYAPLTKDGLKELFGTKLGKTITKSLAHRLMEFNSFRQLMYRYANWRIDTPGRLYSFFAIKK